MRDRRTSGGDNPSDFFLATVAVVLILSGGYCAIIGFSALVTGRFLKGIILFPLGLLMLRLSIAALKS